MGQIVAHTGHNIIAMIADYFEFIPLTRMRPVSILFKETANDAIHRRDVIRLLMELGATTICTKHVINIRIDRPRLIQYANRPDASVRYIKTVAVSPPKSTHELFEHEGTKINVFDQRVIFVFAKWHTNQQIDCIRRFVSLCGADDLILDNSSIHAGLYAPRWAISPIFTIHFTFPSTHRFSELRRTRLFQSDYPVPQRIRLSEGVTIALISGSVLSFIEVYKSMMTALKGELCKYFDEAGRFQYAALG